MSTDEVAVVSPGGEGAGTLGWETADGVVPGTQSTTGPDLYGRALRSRLPGGSTAGAPWRFRDDDGTVVLLDGALDRWLGPCDAADRSVLARCAGATLDIGCGPGRLVAERRGSGALAVGIDVNEVALRLARERGGVAVHADVFGPVPDQVRWGTLLLLDGNLGIGGDPARLFDRCAQLLAPGGQLLVETEPPGRGRGVGRRRLESAEEAGPWFPWATLDAAGVAARATSLVLREVWSEGDRWFAALTA